LSQEEARLKVEQIIHRREELQPKRSRWTLDLLRVACLSFLRTGSRGAFKRQLKCLKISYQRARTHFHSPDAAYQTKLAHLKTVISSYEKYRNVVLFEDEVTCYNHASVAAEHRAQKEQPKAGLAIGGERSTRVAGALDIFTGEFIAIQRQQIKVETFVAFLEQIVQKYQGCQCIYIVLDNWPVHFHPDVIAALQKQTCPYPFLTPASWTNIKPSGKYRHKCLPIQLVPLPTYASWLNPVEKIWRWLKQEVIHNHAFANNFKELKVCINQFLQDIADLKDKTLSIAGLKKSNGIFAQQLAQAGAGLRNHSVNPVLF
jgi:DDE superfamily endonuclease